jgi:hypothetical protein
MAVSPVAHRFVYVQNLTSTNNMAAEPAGFAAESEQADRVIPATDRNQYLSRRIENRLRVRSDCLNELWVCDADGSNPIQIFMLWDESDGKAALPDGKMDCVRFASRRRSQYHWWIRRAASSKTGDRHIRRHQPR